MPTFTQPFRIIVPFTVVMVAFFAVQAPAFLALPLVVACTSVLIVVVMHLPAARAIERLSSGGAWAQWPVTVPAGEHDPNPGTDQVVYFGRIGICLMPSGRFTALESLGRRLTDVELVKGPPAELRFSGTVPQRYGSTRVAELVTVPVPIGREAQAQDLVDRYHAALQEIGRTQQAAPRAR